MIVLTTKNSFFLKGHLKKGCTHRPPFVRMISRLNYKPEGLKFTLASEPIHEIAGLKSNWNLRECLEKRAQELVQLPFDKIFISYSGGIDSTAVVISFLKFCSAEQRRKIVILANLESLRENRGFFSTVVENFKVESIFKDFSQRLISENAILVTGEHGDQLFGSDLIATAVRAFGDEAIHRSYKETAITVVKRFVGDEGLAKAFFENVHPIVEECPFPIRSTHDFFWWYNFSLKWQYVKFRYLANAGWSTPDLNFQRVRHFFDTPYFQKWSLSHHDQKIGKEWSTYKYPLKDFIFEFTYDAAYNTKEKVPSLPLTQLFMQFNDGFDANFKPLTQQEILENYVF